MQLSVRNFFVSGLLLGAAVSKPVFKSAGLVARNKESEEWNNDDDDGNISITASKNRIRYGTLSPYDLIGEIVDKCHANGCPADATITKDTKVITNRDGDRPKIENKKIEMKVDGSFSEEDDQGRRRTLVSAAQDVIVFFDVVERDVKGYDPDTECVQDPCVGYDSEKMTQYQSVSNVVLRAKDSDGGFLSIAVRVKDVEEGDNSACANIEEAGEGLLGELPKVSEGLTLSSLVCEIFDGAFGTESS